MPPRARAATASCSIATRTIPPAPSRRTARPARKIVKVDRVEWDIIPDPMTAANALVNGEVDFWDTVTPDLIPFLQAARHHRAAHRVAAGDGVDPAELRAAAVRQRQGAAGAGAAVRPEGVHAGRRRPDTGWSTCYSLQRVRLDARHRGRLRPLSQARPRRAPSSCSPKPATRASRSSSSAPRSCRSSTRSRRSWRSGCATSASTSICRWATGRPCTSSVNTPHLTEGQAAGTWSAPIRSAAPGSTR